MAPAAKRQKTAQVTELTFDPAARQEYLSGFHKRKVQRTKHAQEVAQKKLKEERVVERRELREQRKRDLEKHVTEVNAALRAAEPLSDDDIAENSGAVMDKENEEAEAWEGFEEPPPINGTDEYIDEDKYTVVTVKELDDVRDFESASEKDEDEEARGTKAQGVAGRDPRKQQRPKAASQKPKPKKKKFRYESKVERQTERKKQKLKNSAAAKARRAQ